MRKWLLLLAAVLGLGTAIIAWLGVEDARQAALLDARVQEAGCRAVGAVQRVNVLALDGAPAKEVGQVQQEASEAMQEFYTLRAEQAQRQQSWRARLRAEVRRRVGW